VLVGYGLLVWAMRMMNRPRDVSLYTGIGVVLGLVAAGPSLMRIWRTRGQEKRRERTDQKAGQYEGERTARSFNEF